MSDRFWNAADLSADLGFGRSCPPRFWRWCERHGLVPTIGAMGFAMDDVERALRRARGA